MIVCNLFLAFIAATVADPEGVQGVVWNPAEIENYSSFVEISEILWLKMGDVLFSSQIYEIHTPFVKGSALVAWVDSSFV